VTWRGEDLLDHTDQDREELAHARGERDFLGFTRGEEATIKGSEHRIAAGADERGHEQRRAHGRPPTPDEALVRQSAAVASQRRDADQRGDLFPGPGDRWVPSSEPLTGGSR